MGEEQMPTPPEFICPITQERMWDPVVASDGHSYERDAIVQVLFRSPGLSPLTREKLRHELFPNVALRKRIAEHDSELADALERFKSKLQRRNLARGRRQVCRRQARGGAAEHTRRKQSAKDWLSRFASREWPMITTAICHFFRTLHIFASGWLKAWSRHSGQRNIGRGSFFLEERVGRSFVL